MAQDTLEKAAPAAEAEQNAEEKFEAAKKDSSEKKKGSFFKGVIAEFKKIIWPSKATVARETGAVVFFSVVLGVLIAAIDALIKFGLGKIM